MRCSITCSGTEIMCLNLSHYSRESHDIKNLYVFLVFHCPVFFTEKGTTFSDVCIWDLVHFMALFCKVTEPKNKILKNCIDWFYSGITFQIYVTTYRTINIEYFCKKYFKKLIKIRMHKIFKKKKEIHSRTYDFHLEFKNAKLKKSDNIRSVLVLNVSLKVHNKIVNAASKY